MLCENCGERKAEVHFVRVVNGEKREEHMCRQCAEEMLPINEAAKMMKMSFSLEGIMNVEEALKSLLLPMIPEIYALDDREVKCPHCGKKLDAEDLEKMFSEDAGAKDAADDNYREVDIPFGDDAGKRREAYRDHLFGDSESAKLARPVQKDEMPHADPARSELVGLKKELDSALRGEKYERAAEIRDRIFELEKNLSKQ